MVLVAEHAADTDRNDGFADEAIQHLDTLYRGALRLTRDPARAEDLVQDTYVRALRYQNSYQVGTNMKAWLFAIMRNLFWDRFKGSRKAVPARGGVRLPFDLEYRNPTPASRIGVRQVTLNWLY